MQLLFDLTLTNLSIIDDILKGAPQHQLRGVQARSRHQQLDGVTTLKLLNCFFSPPEGDNDRLSRAWGEEA